MNSIAYGSIMAKAAEDYKQVRTVSVLMPAAPSGAAGNHEGFTAGGRLDSNEQDVRLRGTSSLPLLASEMLHAIGRGSRHAQELLASEGARQQRGSRQLDVGDLANDPDLEKLHHDRLAELQQEAEKRAALQRRGHGDYQVW